MTTDFPPARGRETPGRSSGPALDAVRSLRAELESVSFPLELDGAERARELRERVLVQLGSHLEPRLVSAALPAVVVVGGPTGAGKSTLVNSIAGEEVSPAGVLRPTTREPVLVVHPDDEALMAQHPLATTCRLAVAPGMPAGIALLDAPDLDSVDAENRRLGLELVEAADVWLFVTTANRYGDALPWEVLDDVRRRGITVGVVLDRVTPAARDTVRHDLLTRLQSSGFSSAPLFLVPDAGPVTGRLEPGLVQDLATWLRLLGSRATSREIVARTLRGVWEPLRGDVRELVDALVRQVDSAGELAELAHEPVRGVAADLAEVLRSGGLVEGAVTSRWTAAASSGGVLEPLGHEVTGFFARRRALKQGPARSQTLGALLDLVHGSFADVVGHAAARADSSLRTAWRDHDAAGAALAATREAADADTPRSDRVARAWQAWMAALAQASQSIGPASHPDLVTASDAEALLALAAAGSAGAQAAVARLWPETDGLIEAVLDELLARAQEVLAGEVRDATAVLTGTLAPEHAVALRVRAGELQQLAQEAQ
ncbi:dynamin family protein [Serinibacter salmoneus]|uniref:Dynamin family protein n=1 Tax=Serinibacter salmoneus TaxID=556530 RepID=A0A2A9CZU5_9MICO|nr:GTPase domain-containing protein [Serinibacter salmoneus]PFG19957.1 dynamin family protein [Serinibacter salmoneus]